MNYTGFGGGFLGGGVDNPPQLMVGERGRQGPGKFEALVESASLSEQARIERPRKAGYPCGLP